MGFKMRIFNAMYFVYRQRVIGLFCEFMQFKHIFFKIFLGIQE